MPANKSATVTDPGPGTIVFVSTRGILRNWAEKRLYDPIADQYSLAAVFWDRTQVIGARGREEAVRLGMRCYEYAGEEWGPSALWRYYGHVLGALDAIHATARIDMVVACDLDVLPVIVWHRLRRRMRYAIARQEVDYYSGSRYRGRRIRERLTRLTIDAFEALLHRECDVILTLNHDSARRLRAWGTPSRRVRIIGLWKPDDYYGGDKEEQKADLLNKGAITPEQYAQLRGRIVLAYFGFFYESTHLAELLKTVASRPNRVALLVAGRGHDQPLVAEYARHNSNVIFLGWLDEDEMRALYRS